MFLLFLAHQVEEIKAAYADTVLLMREGLLLEHSLELWTIQRAMLGPLHPDCAETMHDIATSLETLLACAPRALTDRFAHLWSSPGLASHAHGRAKQLRDAIAALYDLSDVESGMSPLCRD